MRQRHLDGARRRFRCRVVGVDLSEGMLADARGAGQRPLVCGDAALLPLRTDSVDCALMLWMLYHVADKPAALVEAVRVLRPGGRLIAAANQSSESGPHDEGIRAALSTVLGRKVGTYIEALDFHADNGEQILGEHFASVDVTRWTATYAIEDRQPLVDYLDSVRDPVEAELGPDLPWADILAELERLTTEHIEANGRLQFTRTGASFLAV